MSPNTHNAKSGMPKCVHRFVMASSLLLAFGLAGCGHSPTFNILGSFFPSWLICLFAGIILAAIASRLFSRFAIDKEILWPVVVYPCLAIFFACALWLVLFS
jgi:Na+/glutamate symporter